MTSREIAEITGKEHRHVLRDCDVLNENYEKLQLPKIGQLYSVRQLPNGGEAKDRYYALTRIQTFDLMTGYSVELRIKVNRRWEELEEGVQKTLSRKDLALMVVAAEEEKEKLQLLTIQQQKQIKQAAPKVDFYNRVVESEGLVDIGEAAKILKLPFGRNRLFKKLRESGVFFQNRNEPKQQYVEAGYFKMFMKEIKKNNHPAFLVKVVYATPKGMAFIHKRFGGDMGSVQQKIKFA